MPTQQPSSLLRLPEVLRRVGISRASLYQMVKRGLFPKPIPLSQRSVAWLDSEVQAWIDERVATARGGASMPAVPAKVPQRIVKHGPVQAEGRQ